jgi:hypothetical protein
MIQSPQTLNPNEGVAQAHKRCLRTLAHSLGLKLSFCLSPGQSSKELSKESMQLWIMKKEFEMALIENAESNKILAKYYLPLSSVSCLLYKGLLPSIIISIMFAL